MDISVIIPVFNAESYVSEAVESAISQPETAEVILIEDGSEDASLDVCIELADAHGKVRVLTHQGGMNCGASASRNIGLNNAKYEFVSFLDADDFFLPGRFATAAKIFASGISIDGVYEAIGCSFENEEAKQYWKNLGHSDVTTIKPGIPSKLLFEKMSPIGSAGHCSLNGLTIRRSVLEKVGLFDETLVLGEDTAFYMKLASCARLFPGQIDVPVAMRRVHSSNRITKYRDKGRLWKDRLCIWLSVLRWLKQNKPQRDNAQENLILNKMLWDIHAMVPIGISRFKSSLLVLQRYFVIFQKEPSLIADHVFMTSVLKRLVWMIR